MPISPSLQNTINRAVPRNAGVNTPLYRYNSDEFNLSRYAGSSLNNNLGFSPFWDNENNYFRQQSASDALGNGLAQLWYIGKDAFLNNFQQYGRDVDFLRTGKYDKLWLDENSLAMEARRQSIQDQHAIFQPADHEVNWTQYLPFGQGSSAFYGNLLGNLGYTVGTIGAAVVENAALAFLTEGTGNIAMAAKTGNSVYRALNALVTGTKTVDNLAGAALKARQAYGLLGKTGNIAKEVLQKSTNIYQMYHTAAAEAAMEATMGYTQHKKDLTDYYERTYGKAPEGQDLIDIENSAKSTGTTRFAENLAVLSASNYLQFRNILRPFKPSGIVPANISSRITLGEASGKVRDIVEKNRLRVLSKDFLKAGLYDKHVAVAGSLSRFRGFFTEGLEEVSQNVIDKQTRDYYGNIYRTGNGDWIDSTTKAVKENLSKEGFENFLSGALIGGASSLASRLMPAERKQKQANNEKVAKAITDLNSINAKEFLQNKKGLSDQMESARSMEMANESGDIYKYQNFKDKSFRDYILNHIKYGKFDAAMDRLNDLKGLEGQAFFDTFGFDDSVQNRKTASQYVDNLVKQGTEINTARQELDGKFKNPFRPQKFNRETPQYAEEMFKYLSYEGAKDMVLRFADTAKRATERRDSIYQDLNKEFGFDKTVFENILDDNFRRKNIEMIEASQAVDPTAAGAKELGFLKTFEAWRNTVDTSDSIVSDYVGETEGKKQALTAVKEYLNLKYGTLSFLDTLRVTKSPLASILKGEKDLDQSVDDLVKLYDDQNGYLNLSSYLQNNPIFNSLQEQIYGLMSEPQDPNVSDPVVGEAIKSTTPANENIVGKQFLDNTGKTVTVLSENGEDAEVEITTTASDGTQTKETKIVDKEDVQKLTPKPTVGPVVVTTTLGTTENVTLTGTKTEAGLETKEGVTIPEQVITKITPAPGKTPEQLDKEIRDKFNNIPDDASPFDINKTLSEILNKDMQALPKDLQRKLFTDILSASKKRFESIEVQKFVDEYYINNADKYPVEEFVYSQGRVQFTGTEPVNDGVIEEGDTKQEYNEIDNGDGTKGLVNTFTGNTDYTIYKSEDKTFIKNNANGKAKKLERRREIYVMDPRVYKNNDRFIDISKEEFDSPDFTDASRLPYTTKLGGSTRFISTAPVELKVKVSRGLSVLNVARGEGRQRKEVFLTPDQTFEARRGVWQIGFSRIYDGDITVHVDGTNTDGLSRDFMDHIGLGTWVMARVNTETLKIEAMNVFDPTTRLILGEEAFFKVIGDQIKINGKGINKKQFQKLEIKHAKDVAFRKYLIDLYENRVDKSVNYVIFDAADLTQIGAHIAKKTYRKLDDMYMIYGDIAIPEVAPSVTPSVTPSPELPYISNEDLVKGKNPRINKKKQDEIKAEDNILKSILKCLGI